MTKKSLGVDDKEIASEQERLQRLFKDLPEQQVGLALRLIERAAFLGVTLKKLEAEITKNGFTEVYQNGANQHGVKRSVAADLHVSYTKNLSTVMRQLNDLLPSIEPDYELDEFDKF